MSKINLTVLMSDADNFSNTQQINPHYHLENIDINLAIAEHDLLQKKLIDNGFEVITTKSPPDSQDGVYTANWALVRGDNAVLARLPNARKSEENFAEQLLTSLGKKVVRVPGDYKFSGQGDALPCGNLLFCGSGYRSDEEAQKFAADKLGYNRIQLKTIPLLDKNGRPMTNQLTGWSDSFFYDIDLALAIIKQPTLSEKGLIAYCPEAFTPASRKKIDSIKSVDKITVSLNETKKGFATNLISNGETVIMSSRAPILSENLRQKGLKVITLEINELNKGGGFIRCMTLTID